MTERQLLESQKSLAMTNNSLNEGVIRTDSEGIIEYVNLAFIKLLGMDEWVLPRSRSANGSENTTSDQFSSSSASESTSTEGGYQNVSLMTTLVGTPVDDLLQLIQVVITEKSTPSSALDSMASTDVASTDSVPSTKATAIANSHTLRQGATATHTSSPSISEKSSQPSTEARLDSAASTDDDMFDDSFSYKTVLVDIKSMIKRTVASKQVTTLSNITYHQACNEDMYSDVLTQDMLDIVNFQLSEGDHGRNIGYLIRRGGETAVVAVEVSVNPLQQITYKRSKARAKSKNTDGVVLVFRNMTDIMRTQAANKQLADKSRWISVITHELRSLVNGIIGMLDLVKTTDLSEDQRGLVDCMEVSTNALICLVSNTLDHSRLESGKVALEYLPFNMKERLHIVEELMNMMAKSKNVTFSAEIDDTLPEVLYSDFNRLFQILLNLISNAIKFSSHKRKRSRQGKVKLTVKYLKNQDQNLVIGNPPTVPARTNSQQRYESMLTSKEHRHILTPHRSSSMFYFVYMSYNILTTELIRFLLYRANHTTCITTEV
jgi:signal transduction histidine kinase